MLIKTIGDNVCIIAKKQPQLRLIVNMDLIYVQIKQ